MLNNAGSSGKYNITVALDGTTGIKGNSDGVSCFAETKLKVTLSGVGGTNALQVLGKIRNSESWETLATITGTTTTTIDISLVDYVRYNVTVADGTGSLFGSGFIFNTASGGGVGGGDATAANQTTSNASLASIDTKQAIVTGTRQTLAFTGTSAQSSTFGASTKRVVLTTTQDCWYLIGSNPTAVKQTTTLATATGIFLPAGGMTYPLLVTGGTSKVAVIYDTTAGIMSIQESI